MSGTKRFVEQRILKNRASEAKEAELRRTLVENNILAGHGKSELRVESMRRERSEAAMRHELYMDYTFTKSQQDEERRTRIAQFEENLADELAKRKADSLREEMSKRRICDGSEELRQLKERLHAAKVNKERAVQLLDLEVRKEGGRLHEHKIAEHMENERVSKMELEHKLNFEKSKQRQRVKTINQQQIATKEASRQEALVEYIKERDQVEALVAQINKEDDEEQAAREEKKDESKRMLRQFMIDQKSKQMAMEEAERDEGHRIEQYAKDKRAREARLAEEAEQVAKEKERVLRKMLGAAEAKNKEKEELERLRNDLHLETLEAESRRREELHMRKKLEDREEMKNAYVYQMRLKEEKKANADDEEGRLRENLMRKFAEDDRIEQMNDMKRRMKLAQHKREADRLMEVRQQMFESARDQERQAAEGMKVDEGKRQVVIEEERRRLLQEHAVHLKDFLPKYTLESKEDYDFVYNGVQRSNAAGGYPLSA